MTEQAVLAVEDGSIFQGRSIGASGETTGELVFNTAMTGYQEILTDPSYAPSYKPAKGASGKKNPYLSDWPEVNRYSHQNQ